MVDASKAGSRSWTESSQMPILLGVSCPRCPQSIHVASVSSSSVWRLRGDGGGGPLKLGPVQASGEWKEQSWIMAMWWWCKSPAGP